MDRTDANQIMTVVRSEHLSPLVRHFRLAWDSEYGPILQSNLQNVYVGVPVFSRAESAGIYFGDSRHDVAAVVDALATCPTLRKLELSGCVTNLTDSPIATFLSTQFLLKSLYLYIQDGAPDEPPNPRRRAGALPPAVFHLDFLSSTANTIMQVDIESLTTSSTSSLHTLHLQSEDLGADPLSLAHLTFLRHLQLGSLYSFSISSSPFDLQLLHLHSFTIEAGSYITSSALLALLSALPPSIKTISVPQPTASDTLSFLAISFPHLTTLSFHANYPRENTSWGWTPHGQLAIARACRSKGLRLVMPEPVDIKHHVRRWRRRLPRWSQPTLDDLAWLSPQP